MVSGEPARQPYLHDLVSCVRAPVLSLSGRDGQLRPGGVQGVFRADRRVLSRLLLEVNDEEPAALSGQSLGATGAAFTAVVAGVRSSRKDAAVLVERERALTSSGLVERVCLDSSAQGPVGLHVRLELGCDYAAMMAVKNGEGSTGLPAEPTAGGLRWSGGQGWTSVRCDPQPTRVDPGRERLHWDVHLEPGDRVELAVTVESGEAPGAAPAATFAAGTRCWRAPEITAADPRLARLVDQGLADLEGLLLADDPAGAESFAAAGSPWFLTMFGRDSLWAARMMLPLGTDLALGTLRALARRQGRVENLATEEQPGKILHEVRREVLATGGLVLPPLYYGSVDATPLWVSLLAEAWRWGADRREVAALLPTAERALGWMRDFGDARGTGFLEYVDHLGTGLGNQGWKDSGDAIQWRDGRLAQAPIALCEVQGYAYAAALDGAELLEAFGRPGAEGWRAWALALRTRFGERFWVEDAEGAYPAVALDADQRAVDSLTSNIGHLLGTGILDAAQAGLVAARLSEPDMDSGFGLRTLSAHSAGFAPLSYHGGSVWPHDTAIVVDGLAREGHDAPAAALASGLLAAAPAFDYRLPELYAGQQAAPGREPLPYPAACRPQAWAAAAPVMLLAATLGVRPHVPRGELVVRPLRPSPFGPLQVRGLRVAGGELDLSLSPDGELTVLRAPDGLHVVAR